MGKKCKEKNLGRALIKDRFTMIKDSKKDSGDRIHICNKEDNFHRNHLNLESLTEENSINQFINTAKLSEIDFQAQKLNIEFIDYKAKIKTFSKKDTADELLQKNKLLKIPRRPIWDKTLTLVELEIQEKKSFSEWIKNLTLLEESTNYQLTPFEKNLEFWRQLWRVIERSHVVVQIVDARNPLLFRCEDLELYVKELNPNKVNILLINKADFLTEQQRIIWAKYFLEIGIQIAFFSSITSSSNIEFGDRSDCNFENMNLEVLNHLDSNIELKSKFLKNNMNDLNIKTIKNFIFNQSQILNRKDLIVLFKSFHIKSMSSSPTIISFVGYPNVGKSSVINALLKRKKVSVSGTPGKTKHFQTLYLDNELILCDCPGFVMPSFVRTKAEMILNGILPINQIQNPVSSIYLLSTLIPKPTIEKLYGIIFPLSTDEKDINQPLTAEEILNAHGYNRGFMTRNGQPDNARSARCILKDFIDGKLLYCSAPPNFSQHKFHPFKLKKKMLSCT